MKRLPTIEEWKWLINNCKWKWDDERRGQIVTARNGNSIFLPAAGEWYDAELHSVGSYGSCWSSSLNPNYPSDVYDVYFGSDEVDWYSGIRCHGRSVRPVSNTPQEGFVDMGNGVFWAPENESGYYTYDEAMTLFDKKESKEITEHELSMLLAVIREPGNAASVSCHLALQSIYGKLTTK